LKHFGYIDIKLDLTKLKNKDIQEYLTQILTCSNINTLILNQDQPKYAIVIDGIESITATNEKKNILEIQKINSELWLCPIVIISNGNHHKLLTKLKVTTNNIYMKSPHENEMLN